MRGAKLCQLSLAILSPHGEFVPPMMMPLVCHPVVPGTTVPFVGSICGAFAGLYAAYDRRLVSSPLVSIGCPEHRPANAQI